MLPPRVLTIDSTSTHKAVEGLTQFADQLDAQAIVMSSHGRSGLGRFLLGSFAESLMLQPERAVVVVHPNSKIDAGRDFKKLLVPTDLSEVGFSFFQESLALARQMDLEVLLFHSVPYPIEPVIQSGVYLFSGGWMPIHSYMSEETQRRQKRLDEWVERAKATGVQVTGSLYAEGGSAAEAILRVSKEENVSLIAMAVQSGPIASAILGSVAREVVRRATSPVWVLRRLPSKATGKKDASAA
jgi:nucleotide-binding universal stress UspA family protein